MTGGNHAVVLKQCNIKIHEYLISVWIKDLSVKGALGKTACAERWLGREWPEAIDQRETLRGDRVETMGRDEGVWKGAE